MGVEKSSAVRIRMCLALCQLTIHSSAACYVYLRTLRLPPRHMRSLLSHSTRPGVVTLSFSDTFASNTLRSPSTFSVAFATYTLKFRLVAALSVPSPLSSSATATKTRSPNYSDVPARDGVSNNFPLLRHCLYICLANMPTSFSASPALEAEQSVGKPTNARFDTLLSDPLEFLRHLQRNVWPANQNRYGASQPSLFNSGRYRSTRNFLRASEAQRLHLDGIF